MFYLISKKMVRDINIAYAVCAEILLREFCVTFLSFVDALINNKQQIKFQIQLKDNLCTIITVLGELVLPTAMSQIVKLVNNGLNQ
jgi:hypothetical protein